MLVNPISTRKMAAGLGERGVGQGHQPGARRITKREVNDTENERDGNNLPDYIKNQIEVKNVIDIQQVLGLALVKAE